MLEGFCPLATGGRREVDLELFIPGEPSRLPPRCLSFTPNATLLKRPARARQFLRNLTAAPPLGGGLPVGGRSILVACGARRKLEGLPVPPLLQWQAPQNGPSQGGEGRKHGPRLPTTQPAKVNTFWGEQCHAKTKKKQKDKQDTKKNKQPRDHGSPPAKRQSQ